MARASAPNGSASPSVWDTSYEWRAVALLGIGFGLVGLDRWIIASLFPAMAADLGLPEGEIGRLAGILGILWGVFAIFSGRLSDAIGHRKVLIPAIMLFSLMSGLSGMVQGLIALVWIRAIMGAMEGTYCPTSFTAVAAASRPARRGFNQGLQQSGFALMGFALGPIIATQLLTRRAVVALGVLDLRDPGLHRRRAAVLPVARAEGHAGRRVDRRDAGERLVARGAEGAEHRRLHARVAVRDGVRVRARRHGADLPDQRPAARRRRTSASSRRRSASAASSASSVGRGCRTGSAASRSRSWGSSARRCRSGGSRTRAPPCCRCSSRCSCARSSASATSR